jgi:DNA-binding LacI/PurR family transcriptional regulator
MATIYEVAQQAGVSTATVSRAINGKVPVAALTRRRIESAIRALGYEPNHVARSLVTATTDTIAIVLPDITNPFFPDLVKGIQLFADERRYTVLLLNTGADPAREEHSLLALRRKRVDGVILVGMAMKGDRIVRALGGDVPVVVLDRSISGLDATLVALDNAEGARLATQHLIDLGHKAIAHITGSEGLPLVAQRLGGYRKTLRAAGIRPEPDLVVAGDFTEDSGYRATDRLLAGGACFTAIFAANDLTAIGAMAALKAQGLSVPDDVSVVGFDAIHLSGYSTPPLTTVRQPAYEMGRRAAELLIDSIRATSVDKPTKVLFKPELIVRQSAASVGVGGRSIATPARREPLGVVGNSPPDSMSAALHRSSDTGKN